MHIGIVLHPCGNSAKGLEQYVFESAYSMIAESPNTISFTVFLKGNPHVPELPKQARVVHLPDSPFWLLHLYKWRGTCNRFIFFTESAPLFLWRKSIVVFFDAAYVYFGGSSLRAQLVRHVLMWWRGHMLRSAADVVTISEASKKDLTDTFAVPARRVTVIYPGFKALDCTPGAAVDGGHLPFFMYVGPMKERKNVLRIVEAYDEFRRTSGHVHALYLVGRPGGGAYASRVQARIEQSPYRDSIVQKVSVSDSELCGLYNTAAALVFPSLLEGFGLPVLEALSQNCFVITASTTSTKEALGNAGMLVDPESVHEIQEAMVVAAGEKYDRVEFFRKAAAQRAKFNWEKSGGEWRRFLESIR